MVSSTHYRTGNLLLQNAINQASANDTRRSPSRSRDLAGGDYNIAVTVKATVWRRLGEPFDSLTAPTADIKGNTRISVTRVVEAEAKVTLQRSFAGPTDDRALWTAIRNRTAAIGFERYNKFIDLVFCGVPIDVNNLGLPRSTGLSTGVWTRLIPQIERTRDSLVSMGPMPTVS